MDEYKKIVNQEIIKAKNKYRKPTSRGTLKSVTEYLEYVEKTLTYINKQLVKVGNDYLKDKEFTKDQISEIQKINYDATNKLIKEIKK